MPFGELNKELILAMLPPPGERISRADLLTRTTLSDEEYDVARLALRDAGLISLVPGPGRSVFLMRDTPQILALRGQPLEGFLRKKLRIFQRKLFAKFVPAPDEQIKREDMLKETRLPSDDFDVIRDQFIAEGVIRRVPGPGSWIRGLKETVEVIEARQIAVAEVHKKILMMFLPKNGDWMQNSELMTSSRILTTEDFNVARNLLYSEGVLEKGTGRRTRLVMDGGANGEQGGRLEDALYKPFRDHLESNLVNELKVNMALKMCRTEITANRRRRGAGQATTPDICLLIFGSYAWLPGCDFRLISFELKHAGNWDMNSANQASLHKRFAHQSYLAIEVLNAAENADFQRLRDQCTHLGVGLISFSDVDNYETYAVVVEPGPHQPLLDEVDSFIGWALSDETKQWLRKIRR